MYDNYDAYVILAIPYDGYGNPYSWGCYRFKENAEKELQKLIKKYYLYRENDTAYNMQEPSLTNRFEKFVLEGFYFEE